MNTSFTKKKKHNILGLKELRENAEVYIKRIGKGESFTVMRRSTPIFKIIPVDEGGRAWETITDFTTPDNPKGISIDKVISALEKRIYGQNR